MEANNNNNGNNIQNERDDNYEDYDSILYEIEKENFNSERELLRDMNEKLKQKEQLFRKRQIRFVIANLNLILNEPDVPALREVIEKSMPPGICLQVQPPISE